MVNLEWFRTFKFIYESGTLSAAAQALFISQPGVSLHLSSLEAYTGYRLFDRDTRKLTATERGNMLYNYIVEHLNKLEEAEHIFHKRSKTEKPTISLGMSVESFQYMLGARIAELPFNLITRFGEHQQMLQELNTGTLDLVITAQRGLQQNLEYSTFTVERLVLVCGNKTDTRELDELVISNDRKSLKKWLSNQLWYATAADLEYLKQFWMACFNTMPGFRPNYVVPHLASILQGLSNGTGFAVLPDLLCQKELTGHGIRLAWESSPRIENTIHFGKRRSSVHLAEIKKLEAFLIDSLPTDPARALAPAYAATAS